MSTANPVFSDSTNSKKLSRKIAVGAGSQKFKMAVAKPEVLVSQLMYKIGRTSNGYLHVFGVREVKNAISIAPTQNRK
jgi:hypothetical protein